MSSEFITADRVRLMAEHVDECRESIAHVETRLAAHDGARKALMWLVGATLASVLAVAAYIVVTTIRTEQGLDEARHDIDAHTTAVSHPGTVQALGDIRGDIREIQTGLARDQATETERWNEIKVRLVRIEERRR